MPSHLNRLKLLALVLPLLGAANAQTTARDIGVEPATKRIGLLIANSEYPRWPLKNPGNDGRAMDVVLRELAFQTTLVLNGNLREMERAIDRFIGQIRPGDVALFYYSGHGLQVAGENYLAPIDFNAKEEADVKYSSYSLSRVQERVEAAGARLNLLIVDACRNNPFRTSRAAGGGLAAMNSGRGTFIAFATGPGKVADDNPAAENGLFTAHVIAAFRDPTLTLDSIFNHVRERVYTESRGQQLPWSVSSVIGEVRFGTAAPSLPATNATGIRNPLSRQPAPEPAPAVPAAEPDLDTLAKDALAAYSRADFEHSIRLAQEALRRDPGRWDALFALAASWFKTGQYELFASNAALALKNGAIFDFPLLHHHTLTGGHPSTLKLTSSAISFEPMTSSNCNQRAFEEKLSSIVSAAQIPGPNGAALLTLKMRDPGGRVRTLNFADPESPVENANGLPVLVPTARGPRMLAEIANLINAAAKQ